MVKGLSTQDEKGIRRERDGFRVKMAGKVRFFAPGACAFTLLELLVIVVIIVIVAAAALPGLVKARDRAKLISCVGHLKNIGLANRIFAVEHDELFPWERRHASATNQHSFPDLTGLGAGEQVVHIFQVLSNELSTPKIIVCPADTRRDAADWQQLTTNNISYFLGTGAEDGLPQTIMAGDRNVTIDGQRVSGFVKLTDQTGSAAWDPTMHRLKGNVATGDGSVQQLSAARLRDQLSNTGVATNTFIFP